VRGSIRAKWRALGAESSRGYPVTDEVPTGDGGAYTDFQKISSVYWSRNTGAHEVRGSIRTEWRRLGAQRSFLGYPVTDEYATAGGARSDFQGGYATWDRATGAVRTFRN
jgi:uncharacterized protein with LGFP repeats